MGKEKSEKWCKRQRNVVIRAQRNATRADGVTDIMPDIMPDIVTDIVTDIMPYRWGGDGTIVSAVSILCWHLFTYVIKSRNARVAYGAVVCTRRLRVNAALAVLRPAETWTILQRENKVKRVGHRT